MKNSDTVIHLVILATIVSFGMLFYSLGTQMIEKETLILEEVRQTGDRLDTLNERVSTNENMKRGEELTRPADGVVPPDTTTVSVEGFNFELPEGWYVSSDSREESGDPENQLSDTVIELSNIQDETVANITCPVPPRGFTGEGVEQEARQIVQDGTEHNVSMFMSSGNEGADVALTFISQLEGVDVLPGCLIEGEDYTEDQDEMNADFRVIYESLSVE